MWAEKDWGNGLLSGMELENVLALVRIYQEQGKSEGTLLENCGNYMQKHRMNGVEHAKIYAKYAWLVARKMLHGKDTGQKRKGKESMGANQGMLKQTFRICRAALEELQQYQIEYFERPLLQLILECCEKLGEYGKKILTKQAYSECYHALMRVHRDYGTKWEPEDSIFWNCFQKMYHLESEIFRAERQVCGMTQEEASEGIYAEPKTLRAIENDHASPHGANFRKLMERYGIYREKREGFLITDSEEVLQLHKQIQGYMSRKEYDKVIPVLSEIEGKVDMQIMENKQTIKWIHNLVDPNEERSQKELLEEDWKLLNMTYHLLPEEIKDLGEVAIVKKGERGRPKKGKYTKANGYRVPFKVEADILNHIAILMHKEGEGENAIRLREWLVRGFEQSKIGVEYRYVSYSLLLGNLAKNKDSLEDGIKAVKFDLQCGKLGGLGRDYMTVAYALLDDSSNRERCRQMVKDCYYLSKLSYHLEKQKKIGEFYFQEFGKDIVKS